MLELYFILSKFTPMGFLERSPTYKDKVENGIKTNHALFSYPVLMAADIFLLDTELVPVGKDQISHIEMAKDIRQRFNNEYGEILTIPKYKVEEDIQTIPGIDGRKMSKSYNNTIQIFEKEKELKKKCNKIITDSKSLGEVLDYSTSIIYDIAKVFLNEDEKIELQKRYLSGEEGYGILKKHLKETIFEYFTEAREKRDYYENNIDEVKDILNDSSKKVKKIAQNKMEIIRDNVGII